MSGPGWIVENNWTCRTCGVVNPGRELRCSGCGKPKENEAYDASKAASAAAVTDERLVQLAASGANWTCFYCQYQNRGDGTACARCGAERPAATAGAAPGSAGTPHGQASAPGMPPGPTVTPLGAMGGPAPIVTPIGAPVGPSAAQVTQVPVQKGRSLFSVIALPLLLLTCIGSAVYFFWPKHGAAEVRSVGWTTVTKLEQRTRMQGQGWREAMPANATVVSCEARANGTQPCNPYPCVVQGNGQCNPHECNCQNQCQDLGNGFSQCQRVCGTCYDTCPVGQQSTCYQQCPRMSQWCTFAYEDWRMLDSRTVAGTTEPPSSAGGLVANGPEQRVRDETTFTVQFAGTNGEAHEYHPPTLESFRRFAVGQRWTTRETNAGAFEPEALK